MWFALLGKLDGFTPLILIIPFCPRQVSAPFSFYHRLGVMSCRGADAHSVTLGMVVRGRDILDDCVCMCLSEFLKLMVLEGLIKFLSGD